MAATSPLRWPDLTARACADRAFSGAKAAALARAAAVGFPVPRSVVVPCALSAPVLERAWHAARRSGIHAARLEVMAAGESALAGLMAAVEPLGPALAVRSSSPVEDDPTLAGAFSSLMGVPSEQVATAVLAVWASAIVSEPVARGGTMGVLIQPEIVPAFAGTAELGPDGSVRLVATDGPAGPLMVGWASGITVTVTTAGRLDPPVSDPRWDGGVLRAAAGLAANVADALGDNLIEWAWANGKVWLVQGRRTSYQRVKDAPSAVSAGRSAPSPASARRLLRATRWPGEFAERWLMPWSVGTALDEPVPWAPAGALHDERVGKQQAVGLELDMLWPRFTAVSDALIDQVWPGPPGGAACRAAAAVAALRSGQAEAPPGSADPALVQDWTRLAADLMAQLGIWSWSEFLALPAVLAPLLVDRASEPGLARRAQLAALSWEAVWFSAVSDCGERLTGTAVAPGTGCGPCVSAAQAARGGLPPRAVIAAAYPLPQYSPLLMGAAGLVARHGSEAAHLITVARSLGVPVVIGVDLTSGPVAGERYAAVDGYAGTVSVWTEGVSG
jgi:phosphohistidine swiveling domain-containing protein